MAINFPTIGDGETAEVNGLLYRYHAGDALTGPHWSTVVPEPDPVDPLVYVEVAGDTMTGSLHSPDFIGNFGVDKLSDL